MQREQLQLLAMMTPEVRSPTVSFCILKDQSTVNSFLTYFFLTVESHASKASKASYISRVSEAKRKEAEEKPEWNASTTSERNRPSAEDRIANKIASEVLRDNAKLRGVHSANSIKVLLEKEAKRQMAIAAKGGEYTGPVVATHQEKGKRDTADPSNLPYLHKNPAV